VDIELKDLHCPTSPVVILNIGDRKICKLLVDHGVDLKASSGRGYGYLVTTLLQNHDPTLFAWLFDVAREKNLLPMLLGQKDSNVQALFHHLARNPNVD
jgi:hypothetical protein